ncbi:MAG: DMT family transporter [Proteobacteria bacterium]|nr:DMT family transporter [Pseudomonadota bacterium]
MKFLSGEQKGSLLAIASGLLYGLVGYFGIKLMDANHTIANMQFWRFFISALFISFFIGKQFKQMNYNLKALFNLFIFGGIFYSTAAGLYYIGSRYIGTGPSMVIFFIYPVFVMLLNWALFKNKIAKSYYFAISIIILGLLQLVDIGDLRVDLLGISATILSSVCYAVYIVCSKNIKISPLASTLIVSLGCAGACLVFTIADNSFMVPANFEQWLTVLAFGIVTTAIPMMLFLEAMKRISAEKASILSVTEPMFVVIFGVLLLDEVLSFQKIVGIIIILCGALITVFKPNLKVAKHDLKFHLSKLLR